MFKKQPLANALVLVLVCIMYMLYASYISGGNKKNYYNDSVVVLL